MPNPRKTTVTVPFPGAGKYSDGLTKELDSRSFDSKGDRTRHRLKAAAAEAMEETGYADLKVSDICKFANVALGTFYVYFKDKKEISVEVLLDFIDHLYNQARAAGQGAGKYAAIYNTNLFFIHAYRTNPGLLRCHVQLQSQEPTFREIWEPRHLEWLQILARSIKRHSGDAGLTFETAQKIALALDGMVFSYLYATAVIDGSPIEPRDSDPHEAAEMLSTIWYRAIYGTEPERSETPGYSKGKS